MNSWKNGKGRVTPIVLRFMNKTSGRWINARFQLGMCRWQRRCSKFGLHIKVSPCEKQNNAVHKRGRGKRRLFMLRLLHDMHPSCHAWGQMSTTSYTHFRCKVVSRGVEKVCPFKTVSHCWVAWHRCMCRSPCQRHGPRTWRVCLPLCPWHCRSRRRRSRQGCERILAGL